jgi:hypothetical protein
VIYQVSSSKVPIKRWFESREEAIAVFEHECKRLGLEPPLHYPPAVSGDTLEDNGIAYPRLKWASGIRAGVGFVFVEERNQ